MAIWGDWFRAWIAGPRLALSLKDGRGFLTPRTNGTITWNAAFYHVIVTNRRIWSPAKSVRVMITAVAKRRPDGTYVRENVLPLQLTWIYSELSDERKPTITTPGYCDFGFLDGHEYRFVLATYGRPLNYSGFIGRKDSMRVEIIAEAENGKSKALVIEVTWDGQVGKTKKMFTTFNAT